MRTVRSVAYRRILNSHVEFTSEFIVSLADGSTGIGAAPKGETISIYEDRKIAVGPESIISRIEEDGWFGRQVDQGQFDAYLQGLIPLIGRNNAYSLSLAFFNACSRDDSAQAVAGNEAPKPTAPHLCLNILNGGWHAYTNPVLSDFSEFMLVARSTDLEDVVCKHNEIQQRVREKLLTQSKTVVSGNPVNCFPTADNRECIEFLLGIRDRLGYSADFDLMIDASAGDLWTDAGYKLAITDNTVCGSDEFLAYWLGLIREYGIRFLEDPFREQDPHSWQQLAASQHSCYVIGDNFYCSEAARIEEGAACQYSHGVVIKPNQAGTVTAVQQAVEVAQRMGQIPITSHRSISTEETFLSTLTCKYGVPYIKIGPLISDYSSVVRLNEIIRLVEA